MSSQRPVAHIGIVIKANTRAFIRPTVFPVYAEIPNQHNTFGHKIFALPEGEWVEFPTSVTEWIAYLPSNLIFHGQKDPDDSTCWMVSFNEVVVVISDGESNRETRFLKSNGEAVPIRSNHEDALVCAFAKRSEATAWAEEQTQILLNSQDSLPS